MNEDQLPLGATPAGLHFRLQAVERKIDELPDVLTNKLRVIMPTKDDCDKRHASESAAQESVVLNDAEPGFSPTSYKQIFAWIFGIGMFLGSAIYGYKNAPTIPQSPLLSSQQPQLPVVTPPPVTTTSGGGSGS